MNIRYLIIIFMVLANSALAQSPNALEQELNDLDNIILVAQTELKTLPQEKEILESMEMVIEQLDILEIDKQTQMPVIDQTIDALDSAKEIDELQAIEQALIDDGFDNLDLDEELAAELNDVSLWPQKKSIKDEAINPKAISQPFSSVGVKGEEEQLINQLDNSDLMDFDADSDVWLPEVKRLPVKKDNIDDIE